MQEQLYWTGNVAKARIISEILRDPRTSFSVFDYGAGRGGDWPLVLERRRSIQLYCYEPDVEAAAALKDALTGLKAHVLTDAELETSSLSADYIVSFSVLEHVLDRARYFENAKRLLASDGRFYLNYDDGHFRTALDLDELRDWKRNLAVSLQNRLAWLWHRINRLDLYQARLARNDVDALIQESGFAVIEERYENLDAFKRLQKTIPVDRQQSYCHFWMATEDELNRRFRFESDLRMGDTVNLWREMGSRTLLLTHG